MLHKWELNPTWISENSKIWNFPRPTLEQKDEEFWNKCFPTGVRFISSTGLNVSQQSLVAQDRYNLLKSMEHLAEEWPLLAVILAEIHFLLNDSFGAYRLLSLAQTQIGGITCDEVLDAAINFIDQLIRFNDEDNEREDSLPIDQSYTVVSYARKACLLEANLTTNWQETYQSWKKLTASKSSKNAVDLLARYISVTTNEIEGVFSLDGSSLANLVKHGFFVNYISGFSIHSRIKRKPKVIAILRNTSSCFKDLRFKPGEFDVTLLKSIHSKLLFNDNIHSEIIDAETTIYHLVPRGEFRRVFCYAIHEENKREIHYCPWRKIEIEMNWYIETAQQLLSRDELDPYYVSAWLQWAFLYIHPFADGNGRVARMISSIPLLKKQLPPVTVIQERKSEYFSALNAADKDGNLSPLAVFLKREADAAISYITSTVVNINEDTSEILVLPDSESVSSSDSRSSLEEAMENATS